ncbi:cholesterol 7-desaturase isoform X1 [Acipenser oxyrinchus oxyrinchus]|uniref:cholesterol 7-desaturase n=1 Tax=Acipenser oxyrinchus oxyrinchus TaxID=40147 RepID=A0AAD8CUS9_ACIOX|nr:cholesterol 7-desaturase isoform X1 [Acipenser oxyrinchus oxyrinchus]
MERPNISSLLKTSAVLLVSLTAGLLLTGRHFADFVPVDGAALSRPALCVLSGLLLFALVWLYRLFCVPLELLRGADDAGYITQTGRTRAQVANEVRRRRKTGDLPPVYPNGWYRVLDSHMLARGEVKNVTMLGEQVAVFRGEDGQAHVVDAYCPHLGANLAVGGRVVGGCIECPFHGWQFRGEDGKCVRIPYAERVPEFAQIKPWPSCELNGMVLVWYHCDGMDPTWQIPEQEEITLKKWIYRGRTEHFINSHIQEIPENAADIAHLSHLHTPSILSGVDLRYTNSKVWDFVRHHWEVSTGRSCITGSVGIALCHEASEDPEAWPDVAWSPEPEPHKHCSRMLVKHRLTIFRRRFPLLDMDVIARQVGPGVVFMTFDLSFLGHGLIVQCVTPVEPLLQCVSHSIFYQANVPAIVPKFILRAECIQFERDLMIWNYKKYVSKPLLVKEDSAIQRHRRWFSQFYSENSPRLSFQQDQLDW